MSELTRADCAEIADAIRKSDARFMVVGYEPDWTYRQVKFEAIVYSHAHRREANIGNWTTCGLLELSDLDVSAYIANEMLRGFEWLEAHPAQGDRW